jgi:hypothetical protein
LVPAPVGAYHVELFAAEPSYGILVPFTVSVSAFGFFRASGVLIIFYQSLHTVSPAA